MVDTPLVTALFEDAWVLYADAIEELQRGKLRNAAEKAWGATKRATDALILTRTGREPRTSGQTDQGLRILGRRDPQIEQRLLGPYSIRARFLHGRCFYDGMCEPEDALQQDVRDTANYIRDAQELSDISL